MADTPVIWTRAAVAEAYASARASSQDPTSALGHLPGSTALAAV